MIKNKIQILWKKLRKKREFKFHKLYNINFYKIKIKIKKKVNVYKTNL